MPRVLDVLDDVRENLSAGGYDTEWEAELLRAKALKALERPEEAAQAGRRAVAAVERVRGGFGFGEELFGEAGSPEAKELDHVVSALACAGVADVAAVAGGDALPSFARAVDAFFGH